MESCFTLVTDPYLVLRRKADVELEYELLKCLKLLLNHEVRHWLYMTGVQLTDWILPEWSRRRCRTSDDNTRYRLLSEYS